MLAQGVGSIVNIASIAGLVGISDRVAYNTSKHGLIGMTRTWPQSGEAAASVAMQFVRDG